MKNNRVKPVDIFKFIGLMAFFAIIVAVIIYMWPSLSGLFKEGGLQLVVDDVRAAGGFGLLVFLGLQLVQIIVAFIPGEFIQIAAGILYGPWIGALVIIAGCVIASACMYFVVHKLGAPFVQSLVPEKYVSKFEKFEKSGRLTAIVFILYLIPGLPKDVFGYIVPLTRMKMSTFVVVSNVGRIPGVVISTFAASGFAEGRIIESLIIFGLAGVIALLGIIFREKIMNYVHKKFGSNTRHKIDSPIDRPLSVKKINSKLPEYNHIKDCYYKNFPFKDEFTFEELEAYVESIDLKFNAYYLDAEYIGFSAYVQMGDMQNILYLAVEDLMQGQGCGTRIMEQLKTDSSGLELVLMCELLDGAAENISQRKRRYAFYERLGFKDSGYIQRESQVDYHILSSSDDFSIESYFEEITKLFKGDFKLNIVKNSDNI